jgi:DNA-binding CsgD family transcriptional regulator
VLALFLATACEQPFVTPKYNLNVLRQEDSPESSEKQMSVMRMLMAHVQRALLVHWRLASQEQKFRAVQDVLIRLQIAVILLDGQGRIVLANSMGEALFREGRVLKGVGNAIRASLPPEDRRLQQLIAEVSATAQGKGIHPGGTIRLHDAREDEELLVLAAPMRSERAGTQWFGTHVSAAIFVSEPKAKHPLSVDLLEQWFGFTPAEAQVAVDLMNGLDPEEISGRRHVSAETVRSQIKAIYEKTGVNRRGKLGKLLLISPAAMVKAQH